MSKKIEYDECGNVKKDDVSCKHFHQDPYWTPNNFDLYIDYSIIPPNIEIESGNDLIRALRKHLPLSKILHLNMDNENVKFNNAFNLFTKSRLILKRENANGSIEEVMVELK